MKKTLIIALSLILVVVMAVSGTMAYFTAETEKVENTFTIGNIFVPNDPDPDPDPLDEDAKFVLREHEAKANAAGVYTIADEARVVPGLEYTVLPGVALPKDPFVRSTVKLAVDAYVFAEVVENDFSKYLGYKVADTWTVLTDVVGPNGGAVYALNAKAAAGAKLAETYILEDDQITVDAEIPEGAALGKLDFYGYMIQAAGFETAAAAWAAAYPAA